jgi:hypothetical protein
MIFACLMLIVPLSTSTQLAISLEDVEGLHLPYTLLELVANFRKLIRFDELLLQQKIIDVTQAYFNFHAAKQELSLLQFERNNLLKVYKLYREKQSEAEVSDSEVYQFNNAYLAKERAIIAQRVRVRAFLFTIIRLCNLKIEMNHDQTKTSQKSISK